MAETPLSEWCLYSHLLGEEFSLSDTSSCPRGCTAQLGTPGPALRDSAAQAGTSALSWELAPGGEDIDFVQLLCKAAVEKPSTLFSLGRAEHASSSGRAPSVQLVTWTRLSYRREKDA